MFALISGLSIVMVLAGAIPSLAVEDAGIPGSYLRFGSSARGLAMGNATTGLADDVALTFWNPAGLAQLRTMELAVMAASLTEDTGYSFFTFGMPTENWGTFALSGVFTSSGEFERASVFEDLDESFKETEGSFAISYARGSGRFSWGLSLKTVSQNVGGASGSGLGADAGLYFRPHRNISFGLGIQNLLAPEITLDTQADELAKTVRAGTALRFFNNRLMVVADILKTDYMDTSFRSGMEVWPTRAMAVRAGFDAIAEQASFGAGFRWENWQVDYSYINSDLGGTNVLSATLRFGVPYGVKMHRDRTLFSPSGEDRDVTFDIETAVTGNVESWQLDILDAEDQVVRVLSGNGAPPEGITWNGEDDNGRLVDDGNYKVRVAIQDDLGQEWDYQTSVDVLGFRDRTKVPIRVEISGGNTKSSEGKDR